MKVLRSLVFMLAMGAASMATAHASDSFSIGINIGGDGYHAHAVPSYHVVSHHVAPQAVYYHAPVVYHHRVSHDYHHAPVLVQYGYRGDSRHYYGRHGHDRGHRGHDRGHYDRHGHH